MLSGVISVVVHRCPEHRRFWSLSIDGQDGCGTRVLGNKCCVNMYREVHRWPINADEAREIARTLRAMATDKDLGRGER